MSDIEKPTSQVRIELQAAEIRDLQTSQTLLLGRIQQLEALLEKERSRAELAYGAYCAARYAHTRAATAPAAPAGTNVAGEIPSRPEDGFTELQGYIAGGNSPEAGEPLLDLLLRRC